ncbi:MAG: AMP-binding protein [Pseudomonadota bacterium]
MENRPWLKTYDAGVPAEIDADSYPSVTAIFREAVERFPDKPAFECFGEALTYVEVNTRALKVAAYLQTELGLQKGERVAVMVPNVFAFPITMLALMYCGAAQVNVNPLYTPRELAHQLNDAGAETIVIFNAVTPTLAAIIGETSVKRVITVNPGDGGSRPIPPIETHPGLSGTIALSTILENGSVNDYTPVELTGDDILFFQYTGGTTGLSKGAVLKHRNVIANVLQIRSFLPEATLPGEEVFIVALPLYHIFGLSMTVCYLSVGAKMVLIPNPRDVDSFLDVLKDSRFTVFAAVNTLFQGMMMHPKIHEVDFSRYKVSIGGGAAVLEATSNQWKEITGHHIKEGYGLSETAPVLTINPMSVTHFTGCCGIPVSSTEIKLLDDQDNEVPLGEAGEIAARGPQVMDGYWNRPEANEAAFTKDGFFKTGDVGIFNSEGYVKIVDRKKDMILVSGFNVYPNEIEAEITACDGVAECAVIGVPDEKTGEAVKAYVVTRPGVELADTKIQDHCRERLAAYKVPRHIAFIDELPKSNVGKILRRELRKEAS